MINDLEITKYPYLGYSPNLIEYFLIIGYEKSFTMNEILPKFSSDPKATYEPTILNAISSDSEIDMLENDMIIKLIYPKLPSIWSTNNLQFEPQNSSTIFFLNADTIGVNSKIPFHGLALLFNEYFIVNSSKIFIPKALCIISQYPYFSLFNNLNKEILNLFRYKSEIPIEIQVYNLINFIPSPINFSINLNILQHKELSYYSNSNVAHHSSISSHSFNNLNNVNYVTHHSSVSIGASGGISNSNKDLNTNNSNKDLNTNNSNKDLNTNNINKDLNTNNTNTVNTNTVNTNNPTFTTSNNPISTTTSNNSIAYNTNILISTTSNNSITNNANIIPIIPITTTTTTTLNNPNFHQRNSSSSFNISNSSNLNILNNSNINYSKSSSFNSSSLGVSSILQLNGYPVLDFNISEIFNVLPMNMVVEILIFNFLEFDMLFFSKNLEVLNFTMYIIACLNYPCNDSIYLWHILSVSQEELLSSDTSQFVGKPWAAMMGVNCTYNNTIDSCKIVDTHFIVDIDNKNFFFKYTDNTANSEDVVKANALLYHIRRIMKDYNVQSLFLAKNIKNLLKELDIISKQVLTSNSNSNYTNKDTYTLHNEYNSNQNSSNFFDSGDKVKILNKNIQEAFYDFILNILIVFYNNYFLNSSFDKKKVEGQKDSNFFIHYNEDVSKFSKEEVIFYNFFKSSNKYNNYILNFIQEYKCINLYKIPLIFSEEFIYLKKNNEEKLFNSRFFEIIENFYNNNNESNNGISGVSGNNNKKPINVNFHSFYAYYENNLKNYLHQEISSSNYSNNVKPTQDKEKNKIVYEYETIELDNWILFKYLHHLNNITEEEKIEIFPSLQHKKNNTIRKVKFCEIVDAIEKNLINHKIIKSEHLIVFSLILIFVITRQTCNFNESISHLRDILELLDSKSFFLRKYMNLILSIYNLNHSDMTTEESPHCINNINKCAYINKMSNFIIINFLRNKNILPNEVMMNLFENFTLQSEKEEEDFNIPDSLLEEENMAKEHDLDKFNLFLQYHFCTHGTKKPDYFLKLAENTAYEGDLFLECCPNPDKRTGLVFKFDFSSKKFYTEIFSPLKLYYQAYKLYTDFKTHFRYDKLDRELLDKVIINLIFYCKNSNMTYKFLLKFLDY